MPFKTWRNRIKILGNDVSFIKSFQNFRRYLSHTLIFWLATALFCGVSDCILNENIIIIIFIIEDGGADCRGSQIDNNASAQHIQPGE